MKIHLFCFHSQELPQHMQNLEDLGYQVNSQQPDAADFFKHVKQNPPDIFVIDLNRAPSQGCDIGVYFRHAKSTRSVPLIFVGGKEDKVAGVKNVLPDAVYAAWKDIKQALKDVIHNPIKNPVVPESVFAGYSGTPLIKKLGIKEGIKVGLINPPENVRIILGDVPNGVSFDIEKSSDCALYLWFLRSTADLFADLDQMVRAAEFGRIWMIWPKKSSSLAGDLTQQHVRDAGLASGLVDYKVCAVDSDWTGLLFTKRKKKD